MSGSAAHMPHFARFSLPQFSSRRIFQTQTTILSHPKGVLAEIELLSFHQINVGLIPQPRTYDTSQMQVRWCSNRQKVNDEPNPE